MWVRGRSSHLGVIGALAPPPPGVEEQAPGVPALRLAHPAPLDATLVRLLAPGPENAGGQALLAPPREPEGPAAQARALSSHVRPREQRRPARQAIVQRAPRLGPGLGPPRLPPRPHRLDPRRPACLQSPGLGPHRQPRRHPLQTPPALLFPHILPAGTPSRRPRSWYGQPMCKLAVGMDTPALLINKNTLRRKPCLKLQDAFAPHRNRRTAHAFRRHSCVRASAAAWPDSISASACCRTSCEKS